MEEPIGRSSHTVICVRLGLQRPVSPDKYGRSFSEMDKSRLLGLGLQTRWDVDIGSKYVDRQLEASKGNLSAVTGSVEPSRESSEGAIAMARKQCHGIQETRIRSFHEIQGQTGLPRLPEWHIRENENFAHPTKMSKRPRTASFWGC